MVYINGEFSTPQQLQGGLGHKSIIGVPMKNFAKSLARLFSDERVVVALGVLALAVVESAATREG